MKTKAKRRHRLSALVAVLCIAAILASFAGLTAFAQTSEDFEYLVLSETDKTCEITSYTGSATVLDIPAQLDGYTVTSIGYYAFAFCWESLTAVTIPDGVTSIGDEAFRNCTSLTQVTIPGSVTSIGFRAFMDCTSLTQVIIPDSVTGIGDEAFTGCFSLTQVTISQNVTSIGGYVFYNCGSLTQVIIPHGVTSIGESAFEDCDSLTEVTIPNSVTSIGFRAFDGCASLTQVNIPDSVMSIGDWAFAYCTSLPEIDVDSQNLAYSSKDGVLFNKAQTELIQYPAGKSDASYTIPQGVTSIGESAFSGCSLTEVTIPNSVTSIGDYAFPCCDNLTTVTILEGVTSIGEGAFEYCTSLTQVTIPRSVTEIGNYAFGGCDSLTIYGYSGSYAESYAKENGFAFIALAELHDAKSGITVAADDVNVFPENAELAVSVVDTANDRITYDISLQAGGKEIQPNGSVTVKIPVPEKMDGASVKVYRQETDGTLTDMHAIFQDGYAVFTTDHFSRYILEGEAAKTPSTPTDPAKPTDPTQPTQPTDPANPQPGQSSTTQAPANNAHTDIPKTGSASNALAGTCAFMLAIAAVGALGLKKAYRKKQTQA